jgi:hypothetical protein
VRREDYEYARGGVLNLILCCEPLRGWRTVSVSERRTKPGAHWAWAAQIQQLVDVHYPDVERIVLVLDKLNTHTPARSTNASRQRMRAGWTASSRSTTPRNTAVGSTWPRSSGVC